MDEVFGTMKEEPEVLLRELEAGLHVLTCAHGADLDTEVPWPESACQSDLPNVVGTFDLGLRQPYPRPDITGFPDSLDMGFERPSPGSVDMLVSATVVGDVDLRHREIWPVYSLFGWLFGKDVFDLPVSPMDLGFVTVTWDKGSMIL